jgi:hypothetical protein
MSGLFSFGGRHPGSAAAGRLQSAWLFSSAAIFNAVICVSLFFAPHAITRWLLLDPVTGSNMLILNLTAGFIGLFAVAYALVSMDPAAFRVFVPFSIGGKLMAVAIIIGAWLEGTIGWRVPALASGDLLFAIAFWRFLRHSRVDPP